MTLRLQQHVLDLDYLLKSPISLFTLKILIGFDLAFNPNSIKEIWEAVYLWWSQKKSGNMPFSGCEGKE